jgi:hypothetical protein
MRDPLRELRWRCGRKSFTTQRGDLEKTGLPDEYKRYMKKAGFVDVKEVHHNWPINTWPAA